MLLCCPCHIPWSAFILTIPSHPPYPIATNTTDITTYFAKQPSKVRGAVCSYMCAVLGSHMSCLFSVCVCLSDRSTDDGHACSAVRASKHQDSITQSPSYHTLLMTTGRRPLHRDQRQLRLPGRVRDEWTLVCVEGTGPLCV